jgi:hypothetical protein
VMSDNLRQAKTCFCDYNTAIVPARPYRPSIREPYPSRLRKYKIFYFKLCSVQNEAKITNQFKGSVPRVLLG